MEETVVMEMPRTNMFCHNHPYCFLEPRIEGQDVSWECPECEKERYLSGCRTS
jgi:hypothetical protein